MTKKEQLEEWQKKGVEWLSLKLYDARKQLKDYWEDIKRVRRKNYFSKNVVEQDSEIKQINDNLHEVLTAAGIRTIPLRVTYKVCEADWCELENCRNNMEILDVFEPPCEDCDEFKERTGLMRFYTYDITEGYLSGIKGDLEGFGAECIEIFDERTGKQLF